MFVNDVLQEGCFSQIPPRVRIGVSNKIIFFFGIFLYILSIVVKPKIMELEFYDFVKYQIRPFLKERK